MASGFLFNVDQGRFAHENVVYSSTVESELREKKGRKEKKKEKIW